MYHLTFAVTCNKCGATAMAQLTILLPVSNMHARVPVAPSPFQLPEYDLGEQYWMA